MIEDLRLAEPTTNNETAILKSSKSCIVSCLSQCESLHRNKSLESIPRIDSNASFNCRFESQQQLKLESSKRTKEILAEQCLQLVSHDGDPFFLADMKNVDSQYRRWEKALPRAEIFYAVKCCPDPELIKRLHSFGCGFDCASKAEIELALSCGASPKNIIYANPCKQVSHIRYARAHGVRLMTFDNSDELHKIKREYPEAEVVLRILTDDSKSRCKLGLKFGAPPAVVPDLLKSCKELGLNLVGLSFHVGSGCQDPQAYKSAINLSRQIFDMASENFGFDLQIIDVGGGFPGVDNSGVKFETVAKVIRTETDRLFPPTVRLLAEPGRYFATTLYTLATQVTSKRTVVTSEDGKLRFMYYLNDGVYGSFNNIMFDHGQPLPKILLRKGSCFEENETHETYDSSLWGPTCDSIDCVVSQVALPELHEGDWLYFENMGAYTRAAASNFNGFAKANVVYIN
jgi:ornithine decarboxylase